MSCPYKQQARGIAAALEEIQQGKGSRYDPAVVEACIQVEKKLRESAAAMVGVYYGTHDRGLTRRKAHHSTSLHDSNLTGHC